MLKVALTGGIASGKSYVLSRFAALGVPTIDADRLARDVVAPGSSALAEITERFGTGMLKPDGQLDRSALAAVVFADDEARAALEAIVHPRVYDAIARWFEARAAAGAPIAVADIPLLFETRRANDFDAVVVAFCPPDVQEQRLRARNGLSEADARARLNAQWPIADKVDLADYVIRTDGTFADTDSQVRSVFQKLTARGAGEGARRPRPTS